MQKKRIMCCLLIASMMTSGQLLFPNEVESEREMSTISTRDEVIKILNDINTYKEELERIKFEEELARLEEEKRLEEERQLEEERIAQLQQPHFNPYDLREPSNLTEEQIYQILEGNALQTLSRGFYWAEQEHKVNILFVIAITRLESSNGRSSLAISNNNLGGVKSSGGGYGYYNDWGESLNDICRLISNEYLSEDGLFYNGTSMWNVNKKYCEESDWADKLNQMCYEMLSKVQ